MTKTLGAIKAGLEQEQKRVRSAWRKGVVSYAWSLWDNVEQAQNYLGLNYDTILSMCELERIMLNGASSWSEYSWGGCALIYDTQIAETLCTPSELKKTDNGRRRPNSREQWLDVQARALYQAAELIKSIAIER